MKNCSVIIFLTVFFAINLSANDRDTLLIQNEEKYFCLTNRVDSLLYSWYRFSGMDTESFFSSADIENLILDIPDSIYRERLKTINTPIDLAYNSFVQSYINRYIKRGTILSPKLLGLSANYFPLFEEILDAHGLPLELKYLPAIESAFNPNAVSRAGATGIWQIMYRTGIAGGLEINSYVDERRCPVKSTEVAVLYLKDLYQAYQCWNLALAAYNCGPGCLNNAIRRSGGETDFWKLRQYLPRETRNYVPGFIAVTYLFSFYEEHNYKPDFFEFINDFDTVMITRNLHFAQVDSVVGISTGELRQLNPQYRRDIVPAGEGKKYPLNIRRKYLTDFITLEDSIYNFMDSVFFDKNRFYYQPVERQIAQRQRAPQPPGTVGLNYTVKSGDVIGHIARWYGASTQDIRAWNGLSTNTIRLGQNLMIYVPESLKSRYEIVNEMSFEEKQEIAGIRVQTEPQASHVATGNYNYYTVKSGDNPWTIATRFPSVTVDDILRYNGLNASSTLRIGQQLKIPKK